MKSLNKNLKKEIAELKKLLISANKSSAKEDYEILLESILSRGEFLGQVLERLRKKGELTLDFDKSVFLMRRIASEEFIKRRT